MAAANDLVRYLGSQRGVHDKRKGDAAAAGMSDTAYWGADGASTAGKFRTPGMKVFSVDQTFGSRLAAEITGKPFAGQFNLSVLAGGLPGASLSVGEGALYFPFVQGSQTNDLGIAYASVLPDPRKSKSDKYKTVPIGGPAWIDSLHAAIENDRAEAAKMLTIASALGLFQVIKNLKPKIKFDGNGYVSANQEFPRSFADIAIAFQQFPNQHSIDKGRLGVARLVGVHMDAFQDSEGQMTKFFNGQRMTGLKMIDERGLRALKGKTAFPLRDEQGRPSETGSCSARFSGPGMTSSWRLSPRKTKSGSVFCAPTPHVNLKSTFSPRRSKVTGAIQDRLSGIEAQSLFEYANGLGVDVAPHMSQAAYQQYMASVPENQRYYGQGDASRQAAAVRVRNAKAAARSGASALDYAFWRDAASSVPASASAASSSSPRKRQAAQEQKRDFSPSRRVQPRVQSTMNQLADPNMWSVLDNMEE